MDIRDARQMYNDGFRADGLAEYAERNNLSADQVEELATWLRKAEYEVHADEVTKQVYWLNEELIAITGDEEAWTDISSNGVFTISFGGNTAIGKARWIFGEKVVTDEERDRYREERKKKAKEALMEELMDEIRRKMA